MDVVPFPFFLLDVVVNIGRKEDQEVSYYTLLLGRIWQDKIRKGFANIFRR